MALLKSPLRDIAAAFILLSRIALPWHRVSDNPPNFNASIWAFPVVGAVLGAAGAAIYGVGLELGLASLIAATLAILTMILLSGAFHEDGLADTADGFGGGKTLDRKLDIMRDSAVGSYGVIALILSLTLRIGALSSLDLAKGTAALIAAGMLSRLMMGFVMRYMDPARKDGLAHDTGKPPLTRIMAGTILTIVCLIWLIGPIGALSATAAAFTACIIMATIARHQIKGFTGDVLGAIQQVCEISVMLLLIILWHVG